MDNRTIDIISEGKDSIAIALRLVWPSAVGGKATHYKVAKYVDKKTYYLDDSGKTTGHSVKMEEDDKGVPTLILLWHEECSALPLPYHYDLEASTGLVEGWLKSVDYGREPDHDGYNEKGWRIFTERWGHVAGHHYAIVAVQPSWAMYGK